MKKVIVIGSGFAGLSAAITSASNGNEVLVIEKNSNFGGRANIWEKDGFKFDLGPSWYWMPDVFEKFFKRFNRKVEDYYKLIRLDPSYRVYFGENDFIDLPARLKEFYELFESLEKGSSEKLKQFLKQAEFKYQVAMNDYVFRPSNNITEFVDLQVLSQLFKMQMFSSLRGHVAKFFQNERIKKILEFPVLFLGASPANTPAMYSLMNYADISLGTWYPQGGMYSVAEGIYKLAQEFGVKFIFNEPAVKINVKNKKTISVKTINNEYSTDAIIASSDYAHTDQELLDKEYQSYSERYWESREMSPSSLLFYLGIKKKINGLIHHTLFFHQDYDVHASEIYDKPEWPSKPLFYTSASSKSDNSVAPFGSENLVILMPIASGLEDSNELREKYFNIIINNLEKLIGENIRESIVLKRSYCVNDFKNDYNSFKGNAYGLSNNLLQTAFFKPKLKSRKIVNLFNAGQLTVPGPGVPPALISGQIAADEMQKYFSVIRN